MDKNKDLQIYLNSSRRLKPQDDFLKRKKIVQSRIFRFSAPGADAEYLMIGRFLQGIREFQKSLFPLKRATIINPKNTLAYVYLAHSFFELEKENEHFLTIQKALSISPSELALHCFILERLKDQNKLQDFVSFYQQTAALIKDSQNILELYFQGAKVLEESKMIPQALELYKKASETNLMRIDQYTRYTSILVQEELFEEAIVQFECLWKLEPTNATVINQIASLYYELGRVEKAYQVLEYIRKNNLQITMTTWNFILVLYHLGKNEEATKMAKDNFQKSTRFDLNHIRGAYRKDLQMAREKLEGDIDEQTREFLTKKIEGLNLIFSVADNY